MGRKALEKNPECGKRLKEWLRYSGLTAQEVAEGIHYTPQHLSAVITGKKRMTPELAELIASWIVEKRTEEFKNGNFYAFQDAVRAEWLLCKDNYMTQSNIYAEDAEKRVKKMELIDVLLGLLRDGFKVKDYILEESFEYIDDPQYGCIKITPEEDECYKLIDSNSGEIAATFGKMEFDQLVLQQYVDYSRHFAECVINLQLSLVRNNRTE